MRLPVQLWERLHHDGEDWQVVAVAETSVTIRSLTSTAVRTVTRLELTASMDHRQTDVGFSRTELDQVSMDRVDLVSMVPQEERDRVRFLHRHLYEIAHGVPPDSPSEVRPRPQYRLDQPLTTRMAAKAGELAELGVPVTERSLWRYWKDYRSSGVSGLIDGRRLQVASPSGRLGPEVVGLIEAVLDEQTNLSTGTRGRVVHLVSSRAEELGLPLPSMPTLYRAIRGLERKRHSFGDAITRRSQANRPDRAFGHQDPVRPGQLTEIDSTPLDLMVLFPDGEAGRVDLTALLDIATRSVCAAILRPVATKAVDAAVLLARAMTPLPIQPGWAESLMFSRTLLPEVFADEHDLVSQVSARPVIAIESVTVDRGKVFVSDTFMDACERLHISVTKAAPRSPTDKPHIERVFASINSGFTQYLAGYTGPNVARRGRDLDRDAIWPLAQVQDLLDQWLAMVWQNRPHSGLRHPAMPRKWLTPNEMHAALSTVAPAPPMTFDRSDYVSLLPYAWRSIQHYGINFEGLVYDSPALAAYRNVSSGLTRAGAKGRWEVRYDPYRVNVIYVRDHHRGTWIEAPWTLADRTSAPFSLDVLKGATRALAQRRNQIAPTTVLAEINRIQFNLADRTAREAKAARRNAAAAPLVPPEPIPPTPADGTPPHLTVLPGRRPHKMKRYLYGPEEGEPAMGVPASLQAWREFIARPNPQPPPQLDWKAWQRLPPTAREDYDEARIGWLASDVIFVTHDIEELTTMARVAALENKKESATARRGISVSGPSTLGKSTAVLHLGRVHERRARARDRLGPEYQPVAYVVVPAGNSPKMLMKAFSRFLGLPPLPARADDTDDYTVRNIAVLTDLRTSMVIVDEVHNLKTNRAAGADAASALKGFSEKLKATFIYVGVNLPACDLFSGEIGAQVKGRTVPYSMEPFTRATKTGRAQWSTLVDLCEDMLVLHRHRRGTLVEAADYLYERTGGSIGSLRALVADTAARAILDGTEEVTRAALDRVPSDQQAAEYTQALPVRPALRRKRPPKSKPAFQPDRRALP